MLSRRHSIIGTFAITLVLSACGPLEAVDETAAEVTGTSQPVYVLNGLQGWDTQQYIVTPCWLTAGLAAEKTTIRNAIVGQWQGRTGIRFLGWNMCPSPIPWNMVPIRLTMIANDKDVGGRAQRGLGWRIAGTDMQVELAISPNRARLAGISIHEMGHVLGLSHEHERSDRGAASAQLTTCLNRFPIVADGHYETDYDPASAMSYCRDANGDGIPDDDLDGNGVPDNIMRDDPTISPGDQLGGQRMFGAPSGRFKAPKLMHNDFCRGPDCRMGDVDGDGRDDLIAFAKSSNASTIGDVFVSLSSGGSFGARQKWSDYFCVGNEECAVADVNGDGRSDLVVFVRQATPGGEDDIWVALSTGSGFAGAVKWHDSFCRGSEVCQVGDVNGDGRDDVIAFTRGSAADVFVAQSSGSGFGSRTKVHDSFCSSSKTCLVGDVNGDRKVDLISFVKSTQSGSARGDVFVSLRGSSSFGTGVKWQDWMCIDSEECAVADVNADGKADLLAFQKSTSGGHATGDVWVTVAQSGSFGAPGVWSGYMCVGSEQCRLGDIDADGDADAVAFVPANGQVWVADAFPNP